MNTVLLITTLICLTLREVAGKAYTQKTDGGVYTYTVLSGLGTMLFFLLTSQNLIFHAGIFPYAILFAVSYLLAGIFTLKAISAGSLSLTSLIVSCSLLMPTLYGLIFLREPGGFCLYAGIILLLVALILVNKSSAKAPISGKWRLYVGIAFLGNGMCSVCQKAQQVAFDGAGKNELMILALGIVIVVNIILAFIKERKLFGQFVRHSLLTGFPGGISNGVVNLFVMIMLGRMPTSTVFPLISGGSIVLTSMVSRLIYKETLSKRQAVGFLAGVFSIILLNL